MNRNQLREITEIVSSAEIIVDADLEEIGEAVSTELGRVLEAKMMVTDIQTRLENLQ
ncbi:hypothetical protein C1752_00695 [Acaryochloris thomasi RCC1774]|uniref:Uncharacterized protein n=1 Tax=Acaryochloris thomasi RCC1774 TaxID=1764569 RepID=A0A2W1JNP3_9CYAN|nr:hypothetical protein [Acaryochloris thomasi]PZD74960.1 hypothetical protein C1752_00695 [Acaryochloris thomasi RCC1774]